MSWVSEVCTFPLHTKVSVVGEAALKEDAMEKGVSPGPCQLLSQRKWLRSIISLCCSTKVINQGRKVNEHNGSISLRNQNLFGSKSRDLRAQYLHEAWATGQTCVMDTLLDGWQRQKRSQLQ